MADRKIARLVINNVLAIEALDVDVSDGLVVSGANGQGKTSILDALQVALGRRVRTQMVRSGQDKGSILMVMDDGTEIKRDITPTGIKKAHVIGPDGQKVRTPQHFLNNLSPALAFNPAKFLEIDAKSQAKILAEAFPVTVTRERIEKITKGRVPLLEVDFDANGLAVAQQVHQAAYKLRTERNGEVRQLRTSLEAETAKVPDGFDPGSVRGVSTSDLAGELSAIQTHNKTVADVRSQVDRLQGQHQSLSEKIAELQAQLKEVDAKITKGKQWLDNNPERDGTPLETRIKELDNQRAYLAAYDRAGAYQQQLTDAQTEAKDLDSIVKALASLPGKLVAETNIPIEGLSIRDDTIYINDLPFDNLSEGERIALAVRVAAAGTNDLKVVCIDGAEKLSADKRQKLIDELGARGVQVFMTAVTDGSISMENIHGKSVDNQAAATPRTEPHVPATKSAGESAEATSMEEGGWFNDNKPGADVDLNQVFGESPSQSESEPAQDTFSQVLF